MSQLKVKVTELLGKQMPKAGYKSKKPKLTAVGAYIFAGGFTVGVRKHFDVLCHLEETNYGVATCRANMPTLPIYVGQDSWPLDNLADKQVDFVYGNPPCAAWSVAGYTKTRGTDKWKTDPRVACTERHFNLLASLGPKVWVWESVTQAWSKGEEFVRGLTQQAVNLGYSVTIVLHDAQYLGLPQVRKRFFMICHKVEVEFIEPNFSACLTPLSFLCGSVKGVPRGGKSMTPIRRFTPDVLAGVEPGERLTKFWMRTIGGSDPKRWKRNAQGNIAGRPSYGHVRLPLDRPGGAVVGYGIVHPVEHRWLSTEEMQLLSGFPANYHFTPGGTSARASEIARGVCPPVAEWLAKAVSQSLVKGVLINSPTVKIVDYRKEGIPSKDITSQFSISN